MGLADLIELRPLGDCGPPLSDWERSDEALTDKFWATFPDGIVPTDRVPVSGVEADTPVEWLEYMLAVFDIVREGYDVVRLDDLASRWTLLFAQVGMGTDEQTDGLEHLGAANALIAELKQVTMEMMGLGLSMRALARYMNVLPSHVAAAYAGQRPAYAEKILATDDLADADLSSAEIAKRTGYSAAAVKRLRKARGIKRAPKGLSAAL